MIEQAASAARDLAKTPPDELSLIWACQRYGCLPDDGGYLDQDARLMNTASTLESVYGFVKRWRSKEKPNFADLDEHDRRVFYWLKDMGVKY